MNPENEKPDINPIDNWQESIENNNQNDQKSLDDFSIQKENILKNPEFQWLEKETQWVIDKIINDYKDLSSPEKDTNKNILDFLKKDNNLEKVFDNFAKDLLKDKTPFEKKKELRKTWIIKTKIESDFDDFQKESNQDREEIKNKEKDTNQTLRKQVEEKYDKLDPSLKAENNQSDFNDFAETEKPKLDGVFQGDQLTQYLKHKYVANKIAEEVQKSPDKKVSRDKYEFIKSFNEIADKYWQEPINIEWWTPIDTPTNTVKEFSDHPNTSAILEKNDNIKNYIDNKQETIKLGDQDFISPETLQKRTLKTKKEDIKKDINNLYQNSWAFDKLFDSKWEKINNRENIPQNVQDNVINITNKYSKETQSELNNSLQRLVASKSISWSTNEFVKYFNFDKTSNYWDMNFDPNNINIQDNKLQTTMDLNWSKTTFNYDLNSWEIKYSDFLNISDDKNIININNNKFADFPISFPSITSIQDEATKQIIDQDNISKNLENSENMDDFYNKYSEDIWNMQTNNQESPYIKVIIEHVLQKNQTLKKTNELINQFSNNKNTYDNISDKNMVKLYKNLDESFNTYSISDMKRFDNYISRLADEIKQNQLQTNPNTDIIAKTLFSPIKQEQDQKEEYKKWEKDMWPSMTEFFTAISEKDSNTNTDIVNLNIFDNILDKREKNEKIDFKKERIIKLAEKCDNYNYPDPKKTLEENIKPLPDWPSK